jgi:hypothetical protein
MQVAAANVNAKSSRFFLARQSFFLSVLLILNSSNFM